MGKPLAAVLISLYCLFFAVFFMLLTYHGIMNDEPVFGSKDFGLWLTVLAPLALMIVMTVLSIGIFLLDNRCWKVLFFILLASIASFSAMMMACLALLLVTSLTDYSFLEIVNLKESTWASLWCCYLSQIIVFYYMNRWEVKNRFGE